MILHQPNPLDSQFTEAGMNLDASANDLTADKARVTLVTGRKLALAFSHEENHLAEKFHPSNLVQFSPFLMNKVVLCTVFC